MSTRYLSTAKKQMDSRRSCSCCYAGGTPGSYCYRIDDVFRGATPPRHSKSYTEILKLVFTGFCSEIIRCLTSAVEVVVADRPIRFVMWQMKNG